MLKKTFLVLVLLVAVFAVVVHLQPDDFRVERADMITAPVAVVFEQANNLKNGDAWSPWNKLDPAMKKTFEGPESGVGASLAWDGNAEVGAGRMTIIESVPNELVRFRLDFFRPFKVTHTADYTFTEEGAQTRMAWAMYGKNDFIGKAVGLVMNCDKMMGDMFEEGFANLKRIVEK